MSICSQNVSACLIYFCSQDLSGERVGFVLSQGYQPDLDADDLSGEFGRVGVVEERIELGSFAWGHDGGVDDTLVGGARLVIDASFLAMLVRAPTDRFRRRGEHVQPDPTLIALQ